MLGRLFSLRGWRDAGITGRFCLALGVLLCAVLLTGAVLCAALSAGSTPLVALARVNEWAMLVLSAVAVVGLASAALLARLLHVSVTRDIVQLAEAAGKLQTDDLDAGAEIAACNDLGRLAQTFAGIAERLQIRIRELERQQELLQTIFDNIPVVIDRYDEDGRLRMANPEWERTFGWTVRGALGRRMLEKFYPNPLDLRAVRAAIAAADPGWNEFRQTTRAGREIDMLWANIRLSDGSVIGIGQDVTERKEHEQAMVAYSELLESMVSERTQELESAQERLVRQEQLAALGQLAGGVSHELRNPLGVISNAVCLLRMMLTADTEKTLGEYLEIIETEVGRAEKIVTDLLEFGRVRVADRHAVAVDSLVALALDAYGTAENVEVQTAVPSDLPLVRVDAFQIQQVLGNLVQNACQAMPSGGRLTISADYQEGADGTGHVQLRVEDTGCGIPAQNLPRLFEPLFTTKPHGVGLGLAISRNLIEANGGRLTIESVEGEGTTAILTLPSAHNMRCGEQGSNHEVDMED